MFLEKNISALSRRYPEYVEYILNTEITGKYSVVSSSDNMPNIFDNGVQSYFYNNISPRMHAKEMISERGIKVPNLALFLGSGFFYNIIAYYEIFDSPMVIVIENDLELLKLALTYIDLSWLISFKGFHLCISLDGLNVRLFNILNEGNNKLYIKSVNIVETPASFYQYKDFYMAVLDSLKKAVLNTLSWYGNDPEDSLIGIKNTFYNIETIINSPGIKDLKGAFRGKPGIVVSAGPSLNHNMKLLEGLYDKAVIVGADTVLPVLQKNGFKPHMVTSLERISAVADLYRGQTEESLKDIFLAACPVVPKEVYEVFCGEKIIVYRDFATFKWLDIEKGTIDIGPSAGNMAFHVLDYLGCDPIILIGQDLAYAGKVTYVSGTVFGDTQDSYERFLVPGSVDDMVETNVVWNMFKDFYEVAIAKSKATIIDATEGGARIHGTIVMPFEEAINKYIKNSFKPIDSIKKKLNKPFASTRQNKIKKLIRKVEKAIKYSDTLIHDYSEAVAEADNIVNVLMQPDSSYDPGEFKEKLKKLEDTFKDKDFYLIFMHYVQSYVIASAVEINEIKSNHDGSLRSDTILIMRYAQMYLVLSQLLSVMRTELEKLLDLLKNGIK